MFVLVSLIESGFLGAYRCERVHPVLIWMLASGKHSELSILNFRRELVQMVV